MLKQIKLLSKIQLCNILSFNEARYGKDKKKKSRLIMTAAVMILLIFMLCFYAAIITSAYISIGLYDIIPIYFASAVSIVILFFTMFKAGPVIFNMKTYENLIVLPVSSTAIIISRFFTMYLFDALLTLTILVPGSIIYGIALKPAFSFYIMMLLGIFLLPLIPMTVAMAIGVLIYAVAARMKHKNAVVIVFSILAILVVMFAPSFISTDEKIAVNQLAELSHLIFSKIRSIYPPAAMFSDGVLYADIGTYAVFGAFSIGLFAVFAFVSGRYFKNICSALSSKIAKRNYVMKNQQSRAILQTLFIKEIKRYFSSSIYVMNTAVGYILTVIFSAVALFFGFDKLNEQLQLGTYLTTLVPFLLAAMCSIAPTTTSAISIEGKQWWLMQSLPVRTVDVFNAKLLVNFAVAFPFFIISEIFLIIAMRPSLPELVWLVVFPLLYIVFSAVSGLAINVAMPMFDWESETVAVKQSRSVIVSMLVGFVGILLSVAAVLLCPNEFKNALMAALCTIIAVVTIVIYRKMCKIRLADIGK